MSINQDQKPEYYGFIGISGSFTLNEPLDLTKFKFQRINPKDNQYNAPQSHGKDSTKSSFSRIDLTEFAELLRNNSAFGIPDTTSKAKPLLNSPAEMEIFLETIRSSYLMDYAYVDALDFTKQGENKQGPNRWSERALRINKKFSDSSKIFNSFFLSTKLDFDENSKLKITDFNAYSSLYVIEYDIMLLISLRQWELFLDSYLFRMYDLFLPSAKISWLDSVDNEKKTMLVIPYISIRKKTKKKPNKQEEGFSKIVAISLVMVPVNNELNRRSMSNDEMFRMTRDDTEIFIESSPLKEFIADVMELAIFNNLAEKKKKIQEEMDRKMPIRHLFKILSFLILAINSTKFDEKEWSLIANRLYDSFQYLKLVDIDYGSKGFNQMVKDGLKELILRDRISRNLRVLLNDLVAPQNDLNINNEQDAVDFKFLMINESTSLDLTLIAFYNPFENVDIVMDTRDIEKFPKDSIKWGLSWHMKLIQSLSALTTLKNYYYYELEHKEATPNILSDIEDEFLRDLDDFYDLEIRNWAYSYRAQFENSKRILGVDKNFESLKEKISSIRTIVHTSTQTQLSKTQTELNASVRKLTIILIILTASLISLTAFNLILKLFGL